MPFGWLQRISPFAFRTITLSQSVPDKTAHKKEGMPNGGLLPVCGKARSFPRDSRRARGHLGAHARAFGERRQRSSQYLHSPASRSLTDKRTQQMLVSFFDGLILFFADDPVIDPGGQGVNNGVDHRKDQEGDDTTPDKDHGVGQVQHCQQLGDDGKKAKATWTAATISGRKKTVSTWPVDGLFAPRRRLMPTFCMMVKRSRSSHALGHLLVSR